MEITMLIIVTSNAMFNYLWNIFHEFAGCLLGVWVLYVIGNKLANNIDGIDKFLNSDFVYKFIIPLLIIYLL